MTFPKSLITALLFCVLLWIGKNPTSAQQLMKVDNPPPGGAYYSLQKTNQPPFPFNPFPELQVYSWGDIFLFDDSAVDYSLQISDFNSGGMSTLDSGPPPPPGGGGGGGGVNSSNGPPAYSWASNDLWLEICWMTNYAAGLRIHTPTNGIFDLFYTSNLTQIVPDLNFTNRSWLYRTASAETNLVATNLLSSEGYFNLGTMLDSDGDGLTDAYENLVSHTNPNNADTDGDGISDYGEILLGTNPNLNESAQQGSRINYSYGSDGWLRTVFGIRGETVSPDSEGNILQAAP